jgi:hypothetical protein
VSPSPEAISEALADEALRIEIPDPAVVDLTAADLSSLVARTANAYGQISRLAGMARAEAKLAKGRYDRSYKLNREGRNDFEREAKATALSAEAHEHWLQAEAVAEVAESAESAARIASESARKLLGSLGEMAAAEGRGRAGSFEEKDFRPY